MWIFPGCLLGRLPTWRSNVVAQVRPLRVPPICSQRFVCGVRFRITGRFRPRCAGSCPTATGARESLELIWGSTLLRCETTNAVRSVSRPTQWVLWRRPLEHETRVVVKVVLAAPLRGRPDGGN
jgi:hypothetical protein